MDIMGIFDWLSLWLPEDLRHKMDWKTKPFEALEQGAYDYMTRSIPNEVIQLQKRERTNALLRLTQESQGTWPGVCPTSLWNLAVSQDSLKDNHHVRTLAVVEYLRSNQQPFPQALRKHAECTQQFCTHAYEDTAKIVQLHKCGSGNCSPADIPIKLLADVFKQSGPGEWKPTAWDISSWNPNAPAGKERKITKLLKDRKARYMAISHVWSDGTGVGQHKQGTVNSCLMDYWVRAAKMAECDGLWWDTICLPIDPQSRRKALNVMLDNFSNAKVVLVHDQEITRTLWTFKDPQNAAIAIVLSNWFTRGWTAAELSASHNVLVALKERDPKRSEPHLVDLRELTYSGSENLASIPLPSLAHLSAISMINSINPSEDALGSGQTPVFSGLMSILRSRSTAWEKDRVLIASLMHAQLSEMKVDAAASVPQMTRRLLRSMGMIPRTAILHGEAPMEARGGWSWCPPSIFELGKTSYSPSHQDSTLLHDLYVSESGVAQGWFYVMPVRRDDVDGLLPYGSHPMVVAKIRTALEKPGECLVLRVGDPTRKLVPGILVVSVGVGKYGRNHHDGIACQYIGCVYSARPEGLAQKPPIVLCLIGGDADARGGMDAGDALRQISRKGHTYDTPEEVHRNWIATKYV